MKEIKKIMIHGYVTDGYVDYARIFLESLHELYGNCIYVRLDSCNLSNAEIYELKNIHFNLNIYNTQLDIDELAKKINKTRDTILKWKKEVEMSRTTVKNYLYKLYISVDKRYKLIQHIINEARRHNFDYLLHMDIDNYFRGPFLEKLLAAAKNCDIAIYSNDINSHTKKYWGGLIYFNLHGSIDPFVSQWMYELHRYDLTSRWKGFGQSAINFAIEKSNGIEIADLSKLEDGPKRSNSFDKNADIWRSSNSKYNLIDFILQFMFNQLFNKIYLNIFNFDKLPYTPKKALFAQRICLKDFNMKASDKNV